jgi:DNA-binding response OmpR family regulator
MAIRIMVVDDEPAIGKLLVYQLGGFGYQVSYIEDGLLALRRFALERPDLVLLDVMMPQISGWEVCRQIRACSSAPVIMLTAKNADTDVVTGLGAGADDYITKPFSMVQLQARIETVLRRAGGTRGPFERTSALPQGTPHRVAAAESYSARMSDSRERPPAPKASRRTPETGTRARQQLPAPSQRLGQRVHEARLSRGLSLHQVERICKIRWEFLQAIEQENFAYVPREELQQVLKGYTEYLGLDLRELLGRSKPAPKQLLFPTPVAFLMMLMLALIVVGLYLL